MKGWESGPDGWDACGGLFDLFRKKENVKFETATNDVSDAIKKTYARLAVSLILLPEDLTIKSSCGVIP